MFAAVLHRRRRPLDCSDWDAPHNDVRHVERPGRNGHVLFLGGARAANGSGAYQSASDEGRLWIMGRIRLDAREALCGRLGERDGRLTDAELCLRAYARWGERFVEFLAGDFAFVLWDEQRQRLCCVRDQIGVRALFHASAGDVLIVGDSLDWVASRQGLARDLDDLWIADFLAANLSDDHVERTVYRSIRRLPPGHMLMVGDGDALPRRYWSLEIGDPLRLGRREAGERFRDLLRQSISDRLPSGTVGVAMSGGLDSTTLAAIAVEVTGDPSRVRAECDYFERLLADEEKHYSALVARHLGIDLHLRAVDDLAYDPKWRERPLRFAEPAMEAISAKRLLDGAHEMAAKAGVWLYGEGPDNALRFDRDPYLAWLRAQGDWAGWLRALAQYAFVKGVDGWWSTLRRHAAPAAPPGMTPLLPEWLSPDFVQRTALAARIEARAADAPATHAWHPRAHASFSPALWQRVLGDLGNDERLAALEWRHPFLDLRMLEFMLSLPPIPWAWEKHLIRDAMRGRLPPAVLARKKAPLRGSPLVQPIREHGLPPLAAGSRLAGYVDASRLPTGDAVQDDLNGVIAVHVLDHWLASSPS